MKIFANIVIFQQKKGEKHKISAFFEETSKNPIKQSNKKRVPDRTGTLHICLKFLLKSYSSAASSLATPSINDAPLVCAPIDATVPLNFSPQKNPAYILG